MSIFDFIYLFLLCLLSPLLPIKILSNRRFRSNFFARFNSSGNRSTPLIDDSLPLIWVHAASIGEIRLALKLIKTWKKADPHKSFIITTNTVESRELGRQEAETPVELAPLDLSLFVKRFIARYRPQHLVLIETEIWPNMIRLMSKRGKISIVNGRLSDRYFNRYMRLKGLLHGTLSTIDLILARDEIASERFLTLGVPQERISCQGNLKYDLPVIPDSSLIETEKSQTPVNSDRFLLVVGSIQPEELHVILPAWQIIRRTVGKSQLIVIPRHPDKKEEIEEILSHYRISYAFSSDKEQRPANKYNDILYILDKFGILNVWYYLADVIFVGGSLCDRGGQNMVEAVGLRKPVCIGPYATNFKDEVELLTGVDGLTIIHDENEMAAFVQFCHDHPEKASAMAERGYKAIEQQLNALTANVRTLTGIYH